MLRFMDVFTVRTRYEGPTDSHGARIVVTATHGGKRVRRAFPYDYAAHDPHIAAADAYAVSKGWAGEPHVFRYDGETRTGRGKVLTMMAPD